MSSKDKSNARRSSKKSSAKTQKTSTRDSVGSMPDYSINIEQLKGYQEKFKRKSSGGYFKMEDNTYRWVRVFPTWKENGIFFKEIESVWMPVVKEDGTVGNTKIILGGPKHYNFLVKGIAKKYGVSEDSVTDKLKPKYNYPFTLVDIPEVESDAGELMREYDPEAKPSVWEAPKTVVEHMTNLLLDPEYGDFTSFSDGYDLKVTRTKKGNQVSYSVTPSRNNSSVPEEWAENIIDLDDRYAPAKKEKLEEYINNCRLKFDGKPEDGEFQGEDVNF